MKRLLPFILAFAPLTQISCGPTKRVAKQVVAPPSPLAPVPDAPPTAIPPGLTQLGDQTIQADELDAFALEDALKLSDAVAQNTSYFSVADTVNGGGSASQALAGVELGMNTLSTQTAIKRCRVIGQKASLIACDRRDFFGSRSALVQKLIEDTAVLKIQSQTTRNKQLQFITKTRIPIMHAKIMLETAFLAPNYYNIQQTPLTEELFIANQGINRQADFDAVDDSIYLAAMQVSVIAPGHNRGIRRMENKRGTSCYDTSDVDSLFLVPESNFFANPFPVEARQNKNFIFNAREIICIKSNGLMTFWLGNAAGARADVAPGTVVVNTRAAPLGLEADIKPRDCLGCHANTQVLKFQDEMRKNIADRPFNANEKRLGNIFFRPQAEWDAVIDADNKEYEAAIARLGISPGGTDPMNAQIDQMRDGYDLKELADFLYLSQDEFLAKLQGSEKAQSKVGALLNGGRLPFFALQDAIADIIQDLNLFRDTQR